MDNCQQSQSACSRLLFFQSERCYIIVEFLLFCCLILYTRYTQPKYLLASIYNCQNPIHRVKCNLSVLPPECLWYARKENFSEFSIFFPFSWHITHAIVFICVYFKCLYYMKRPAVFIYFCLLVGPVEIIFQCVIQCITHKRCLMFQ